MSKRKRRISEASAWPRNSTAIKSHPQQRISGDGQETPSQNKSHISNSGRRVVYDEHGNVEPSHSLARNEDPLRGPTSWNHARKMASNPKQSHHHHQYQSNSQHSSNDQYGHHHNMATPPDPSYQFISGPQRYPSNHGSQQRNVHQTSPVVSGQQYPSLPVLINTPKDNFNQYPQTSHPRRGSFPGLTFSSNQSRLDPVNSSNSQPDSTTRNTLKQTNNNLFDISDTDSNDSTAESSSTTSSTESDSGLESEESYNTKSDQSIVGTRSETAPHISTGKSAQDNLELTRSQSAPSREELRVEAEKQISTAGKRLKAQEKELGKRFTFGLESRLVSNLHRIIPEHMLTLAEERLVNEQKTAAKTHKRKGATKDTTMDNKPRHEAIVLQAAKELIVKLSVQKIAIGAANSYGDNGPDAKSNTHITGDRKSEISNQTSDNMLQGNLARICRERGERIEMLELELQNHRNRQ